MKNKLKVLLPLLFVIALLAVMAFTVSADDCEHNIVHVKEVFSCQDGNLEHWYCENCNGYWLDEALTISVDHEAVVLPPALEHQYVDIGQYFKCLVCEDVYNPFGPVEPEKWYNEAIFYCHKNGYMKGVSESNFAYREPVTRAMFVTILVMIDDADVSSYIKMSFSDVRPGMWYSNSIEWAYQKGYAAGLGEGVFGYKDNVTREQLVTFFYTYSAKNGIDVSGRVDITGYADYDRIHDYALDAMSWAVNAGLVAGTSETTLSPRSFATRAEIAVIVMNCAENILPGIRQNYWIEYGLSASARITGDLMPSFGPVDYASKVGLTVTLTSDVYEISGLPEFEVYAKVNGYSGKLELDSNSDALVYKLPYEPETSSGGIHKEIYNIASKSDDETEITVIVKVGDEIESFKVMPEISVTW